MTPQQIDQLTLPELVVLCEDDKASDWGEGDIVEYLHWWHGLTAEQQLYAEEY